MLAFFLAFGGGAAALLPLKLLLKLPDGDLALQC